LFDATMILLQSIVEVAVGPVQRVIAQGLADRTRGGVMSIGGYPFWGVTNHSDGLRRSKRLAASISRFSTRHRSNQMAIPIDGAIQMAPCPFDVDIGFINVPGNSCLSTSFCPQLVCHEWSKTGFPVPDRFMGELKAVE
jgi:hypothetical protein